MAWVTNFQRLQGLTEQELGLVVQTAQFVKMAHSFGDLRPDKPKQSYIDLTRSMYPKLPFNLQSLISDVLQDAEPIEEQRNWLFLKYINQRRDWIAFMILMNCSFFILNLKA